MVMKAVPTAFKPSSLYLLPVFLALYATAIVFRPPVPIDETRYLTVAWEMLLRHDWLAPLTVNFAPYHHKPPLLFWMINVAWSVFGVSRWAATIPVVLASALSVVLTGTLCKGLLPGLALRAQLVLLGTLSFLVYSTGLVFDLTLTVFVLGALLTMLAYGKQRRFSLVVVLALLLGLGVLTKGPVMYLYVAFPALLAPYWINTDRHWRSWYGGIVAALFLSTVPVLIWLVPVLKASSNEFGYWLVWEQTAGRITGSYAASHSRPVYFYVLMIPIMWLPWIFFRRVWSGLANLGHRFRKRGGLRFLLLWLAPTFLVFSLISGKQPHYLVPLLPGTAIVIAHLLRDLDMRRLWITVGAMLLLFIAGHAVLSQTLLQRFDLRPVAAYVAEHRNEDWAFVRNYEGEIGFLARLQRPVKDLKNRGELDAWFDDHPDGLAMLEYSGPEELAAYRVLSTMPYRGANLAIVCVKPS
jgi:4-amino-4-deoxy-L-arabinose transferase-like glycosyltransferase